VLSIRGDGNQWWVKQHAIVRRGVAIGVRMVWMLVAAGVTRD